MLIKDIMTRKVVTVPANISIGEAKKILKENRFRRLPVLDNGKLVGIVTEDRLERVSPPSGTPLLWQIGYLISHTTVKDVMQKEVVTIEPEATVEHGVALAQARRVGALVVVKNDKIVGIATTNDFFYNVLNPVLGIGQDGSRICVAGAGEPAVAQKVLDTVMKAGVGVKSMVTMNPVKTKPPDLVLHLDTGDPETLVENLKREGFAARVRPR